MSARIAIGMLASAALGIIPAAISMTDSDDLTNTMIALALCVLCAAFLASVCWRGEQTRREKEEV